MFRTAQQLHYTGSSNKTETHNDVTTAVTHVNLVLDSLTPALAAEISPELRKMCFTKDGGILDALSKMTFRTRAPQQRVTAKMAADVAPHVVLSNVRIPTITITKRGEEKDEPVDRKSRKVAPAASTLRATLNCLMLPDSNASREFLTRQPGNTFLFEFEAEEKQLDFGPDPTDDDEDENGDDQRELALDDQPRGRRRRQTTVEAEGPTDAAIAELLAQVSIELKPKQLAAMTVAHRQQVIDWVGAYQLAREQNAAELPPAPSFLLHPAELTEAGDVLDEKADDKRADRPPARQSRAPRRSSKAFKNGPRLVNGKKKGGRR